MTLRLLVTGAVLAASVVVTPGAVAAPRGLTIEDLATMDRVGSPALSPDASRVVYTVRSTDLDKNRGITQLWMIDLRAARPAPQQLTSHEASSSDPEWSASGDAVYFLSGRSGSSQVWRLPAGGGEAARVTDLPVDVDSFHVSPTGDRLAVTMAVFRDCPDLACTKGRIDARAAGKATGKLYDRMFVRHWDTWADGRRNVLYSVPLAGAAAGAASGAVSLSGALDGDITSKPFGDNSEYAFSPDGRRIVFAVRVAGRGEAWSTNFDLYDVPAAGGAAPRNLTADNPAWDTKPRFSPDGRTLAWLAMKRPGFESDRFHLVLQDVATGSRRVLAEGWDRSIADYRWRPDGKALLASADDVGNHRLFSLDVASGRVGALTDHGHVGGFDARRDTVVIAQDSLSDGAQLFLLAGTKATRLTQANRARLADVRMGEHEQFSFAGANGDTVHGYVMKPWNAVPGRKYPVAFLVHGGPQGSFGNAWSYRWNPQVYAGAGYATVFIDFHGSTGYGQAYTDSISGDWGGKPLEDLQKGLAAAGRKYPWLDTANACALGASYGGYMMNWIEGNWSDGFQCIVNHDGVFDQRAMGYSTEELWFTEWENGGTPYANPQGYERFNPVHHVAKWKTPMLVIQGDLDFRIPTAQALGTFTALQRRGIESQLLVFPDENHWVLKPANSIQWHHTVLGWLDRHLKK